MKLALRLTFVICLLGTAGAGVPTALAGTYTVWSCRGPAAEPVPATAWEGDEDRVADDCAQGGALRVGANHRHDGGASLRAPEDAEIAGYRIWRSATVDGWGSHATVLEQPFDGPVGGCFTEAGCGDPSTPLAAANLVERSGVHLRALAIAVGCHWHCWHGDAEFRLYRSAVDVTDATPPVAAGALGRAAASITVPAHDDGGGLRSAQALIDGRPVATAGSGCAEPYSRLRPCPADATFTLALDTTALAAGAHTLTVEVSDAAGNTATLLSEPLAIEGAQPAPSVAPAPSIAPAPRGDPRLIVSKRRFAAGASGEIAGQVMRGASAEPGASVVVERRWYGARGGGWRRAATLTTDARGAFALRVPAAAQQVRFRLAQAASPPVDVVSRLRLSASVRPATLRNGEAVVLSGRLAGAGPAARGERVRIQAMVSGRWADVGRATADGSGHFRWRYRFRNTRLEALYSFRARVTDASARWPWPALSSRRVTVHVIP